MIGTSTQVNLSLSYRPHSSRARVEEIIESPAASEQLRRHIRAELRRQNTSGRIDPDDVFQHACIRGLDSDRPGPRGDTLCWLKKVASNQIVNELRKQKFLNRCYGEAVEVTEPSVPQDDSAMAAELIGEASASLDESDQRLIELMLQDLPNQVIASKLGFRNKNAARDARYRVKQKLRKLIVGLRGD